MTNEAELAEQYEALVAQLWELFLDSEDEKVKLIAEWSYTGFKQFLGDPLAELLPDHISAIERVIKWIETRNRASREFTSS